jgi:predicted amidohydrolase YtcJ
MRQFTLKLIVFAALIAVTFPPGTLRAQVPAPDLILFNGKIITVDQRFSIAQAVAVRGDRIVAVGTTQDISKLAGSTTKKIDLKGKSVIPGLIDNHMHLLRAGTTWARELRLDGVESRKQALEMLTARAKAVGAGQWVYTIGGWAHQQFADDSRPFSREELDKAAPNNPVALQESYYQTFLNTPGMRALGINENEADPTDLLKGSIQRDAAGNPLGLIGKDMPAVRPVAAKLPKVPAEDIEASTLGLIKDVNRAGLTAFGVAGCDPDLLSMYRKWESENQLNVRVYCIDGEGGGTPEQVDKNLAQISKIRLFQGDNYIDQIFFGEGVYGPLSDPMFLLKSNPKPEDLAQWRRIATEIAKAGLPLHVHVSLENTIDGFLDQVEAINKEYPIHNLRWVFAHVTQLNEAELDRMKKLNMYAAVHPWTVINGGIFHEIYGDRAFDMPSLTTIQNSGIVWGFGSDATAANQYRPFITLGFAVTGKMVGGRKVINGTISREDALIAYTRNNAFLVFQEDNLGSIQPGKLADMLVLDRDYLTVPADQIKDLKPVITMVGGRIVYDAGTQTSAMAK